MKRLASYVAVAVLSAGLAWVIMPARQMVFPAPPPPMKVDARKLELSPEEQTAVNVYENVNRSVVHITTRSQVNDDFGFFSEVREGTGSGSVLDQSGHIVTNNHVVEDARRIQVLLWDGSVYPARLVGADPIDDVAVIQIDAPAEKLYPITWGDSNQLLPGMRVFAIGNPFGYDRTLTDGIVSNLNRSLPMDNNRTFRGLIQTNAAINPGNSGGPLLNKRGDMVGINMAIISRAGQSSGVGLAIPSNLARRVVDDLIRHGKVVRGESGILSVFQTDHGLLISRLDPNGPAAKAGLRGPQIRSTPRGRVLDRSTADLIVGVDGHTVKTLDDLLSHLDAKKPGDKAVFQIIRDGKEQQVALTMGEAD
ncbi:MAG TPA: trypsin-like peptidase domain-containing protein [Gemmataceae bacterium]|nr:trypsin-like peptidase domain-containing protein [Gemmataceae bacterium]